MRVYILFLLMIAIFGCAEVKDPEIFNGYFDPPSGNVPEVYPTQGGADFTLITPQTIAGKHLWDIHTFYF